MSTLDELLQSDYGPSPLERLRVPAALSLYTFQEAYFKRLAQEREREKRVLFGMDVFVTTAVPENVIVLKACDNVGIIKIGERKDEQEKVKES
jgi:hypothetical protein